MAHTTPLQSWSTAINVTSKKAAMLGPPNQIACYSMTAKGVEYNTTSLRYFVNPPLGTNLNDGSPSFMHLHKDETRCPQRLDDILLACLESGAKEHLLNVDVVVRRGCLLEGTVKCRIQIEAIPKVDLNIYGAQDHACSMRIELNVSLYRWSVVY